MIIDDDPVNNLISRETIRHFDADISVVEYEKPTDALDYLISQSRLRVQKLPDVIFLDLNMPFMDGWSFLEQYKSTLQYFNSDIDVYLLTSSSNQKDLKKAKSFPIISHYITKPLTTNILSKIRNDETLLNT